MNSHGHCRGDGTQETGLPLDGGAQHSVEAQDEVESLDTGNAYGEFPQLVSVETDGMQGIGSSGFIDDEAWWFFGRRSIALSGDGRFVIFPPDASNLVPDDTNGMADVFVRDRATGKTAMLSVSGGAVGGGLRP